MNYPTKKKLRHTSPVSGEPIGWEYRMSLDDLHVASVVTYKEFDYIIDREEFENSIWNELAQRLKHYMMSI